LSRLISRLNIIAGVLLVESTSFSVQAASFECLMEPSQVVDIRAPIEGLIETVHVDRGDVVKKGQTLVMLDMGVDKSRYDQAKYKATMRGALETARSRLNFSNKKFGRDQELFQDQYVSANTRDESETAMKLAASELLEAKDNNHVSQLQVREYEELMKLKNIKSPFDGVVMERFHHPGEVTLTHDQNPLLKLARINPLFIEVVLPAASMGKVHVGDVIKIKPQVDGINEFNAKVTVVDPVADAASSTLGVRLEVENKNQALPAGISCKAEFPSL
jgi:RND family efflux transporter MFP subunit